MSLVYKKIKNGNDAKINSSLSGGASHFGAVIIPTPQIVDYSKLHDMNIPYICSDSGMYIN